MKKVLLFIICLFSFSIVNAKEYKVFDMTVDLGDKWVVFTRDNWHDETLKKKIGLDETTDIEEIFNKDNIYIDAIYLTNDKKMAEFFVSVTDVDYVTNMNNVDDEDLNGIIDGAVKEIEKQFTIKENGIYKNDYKYVRFDYIGGGWRIYYYLTFVNNKCYKLYVRYPETQSHSLVNEKEIIDSVKYDVDKSLKEVYYKYAEEDEDIEPLLNKEDIKEIIYNTVKDTIVMYGVYLAIALVVVIIIVIVVKRKDKKNLKNQNKEFWQ